MRIVLWIGNEANQKALANKISLVYKIDGIITETRNHRSKITPFKVIEKIIEKIFLPSINKSWWGMKKFYENNFSNYPNTKILDVENINSQNAFDFTNELNPDLIIVSGTRLIKDKMLSIKPPFGIFNLHTGLSPYIKGGPNCTNWCITIKKFHLIGNTIMLIDSGIDSGNIVKSEFTDLDINDDLLSVHIKVMEHAHNLCLRAIGKFVNGKYLSIKQSDIANGTTYYTKEWGLREKILLIKNMKALKKAIISGELSKLREGILTVD